MTDSAPGRVVGAGRNADVFDIGGGRVLRRYRDGRPASRVAGEAEVMVHARAHGVPVPEVFDVDGGDIVMARADGPTMMDAIGSHPWTLRAQARLLASLHAAVHAVEPLPWLPAPAPAGPAPVLLHTDLHPQNVILTADGPMLIDWEGAAQGPAQADIAMTWVIIVFSQASESPAKAAAVRLVQGLLGRAFLRAAAPTDRDWLERAMRYRLTDPNLLPAEHARLTRALRTGNDRQRANGARGGNG